MIQPVASRLSVPSARSIERGLAGLLVGLLAVYALGTLFEGTLPPVYNAGVLAVHLAVGIGLLFPIAVLVHAAINPLWQGASSPGWIEVGLAIVSLGCLLVGTLAASEPLSGVLLGVTAGGTLLLSGLVILR